MTAPRRPYSPRKTLLGLLFLAVLVFYPYLRAANLPRNYEFGGETMGTRYVVKVANSRVPKRHIRRLQNEVENRLATLNRAFSTYDPTSQISRFNTSTNITPISVSPELARVTAYALKLSRQTGGAFDPTLKPLVSAWGFYHQNSKRIPTDAKIAQAQAAIGPAHIRVPDLDKMQKTHPGGALDLNAVAKGYAVDEVTRLMQEGGCPDVYVDIGGEIKVAGTGPDGGDWRIAIETPKRGGLPGDSEYLRVALSNVSIASSGDYRNFFKDDGVYYTHILDPRTGSPVTNGIAAASVIAPDCMVADALATALMVLDIESGLELVEETAAAECLLIVREADGSFLDYRSRGFNQYVIQAR